MKWLHRVALGVCSLALAAALNACGCTLPLDGSRMVCGTPNSGPIHTEPTPAPRAAYPAP